MGNNHELVVNEVSKEYANQDWAHWDVHIPNDWVNPGSPPGHDQNDCPNHSSDTPT